MPTKKITITTKPQGQVADDWVNSGEMNTANSQREEPDAQTSVVPPKRLTIDIPEELHARIKSQCALRRTKMADEIRVLLEIHFSV